MYRTGVFSYGLPHDRWRGGERNDMARPHTAYAEEWEKNARIDPLFAILTHPHARNRRWIAADFFATGETEIEFVLAHLRKIGMAPNPSGTFLDFGCGVGR